MKRYTEYETGSWPAFMGESFTLPGTSISAPGKNPQHLEEDKKSPNK